MTENRYIFRHSSQSPFAYCLTGSSLTSLGEIPSDIRVCFKMLLKNFVKLHELTLLETIVSADVSK